jgi:hypothetical protein
MTPMGPVQVDNGHAIAYCSAADVEGLDNSATLVARGVTYKVTSVQIDFDGFTTLGLSLD